jgi:hypothetical protein
MPEALFGYSILTIALIIVVGLVYFVILVMLGWESHSKYGTGYYWVGACLAGAVVAWFNYKRYLVVPTIGNFPYPLWLMITLNVFIALIGLWAFLIYYAIVLKKTRGMRSGARLVKRVFSENQAATGTGRYRDHLKGWEGDTQLDMLIFEKKFDIAEDYLEGVLMKASNERDKSEAQYYMQYKSIIQRERLSAEESKKLSGGKKDQTTISKSDPDFKRTDKIDKDVLPEGWTIPD